MKKVVIFGIFILFVFCGFFLLFFEGTLPMNKKNNTTKVFTVDKGENLNTIIKKLASEGLIRNRIVFYLVVKQLNFEKKIQAGDFRISPSMNAYEIARLLTKGTSDIWVTVIEGLRKEEIAQTISESIPISEIEFVQQAKEGYLFPDTYMMPKNASIETILSIFSSNFKKKYTVDLQKEAQRRKLNNSEVIILASLVEREAQFNSDKKQVANILLKRYRNDWPLQLDATIQYALGFQRWEKTWWKKTLSEDDLKVDSQFNTYIKKGLPPSPICSPGINSIEAVATADENTPYWFYISDKTGKMHYSETLEEHNALIKKYLD